MQATRLPAAALLASALVGSTSAAQDQQVLYSYDGNFFENLGSDVAGIGDVDGDGFQDFLISVAGSSAGGTDSGRIRVHSGRLGTALLVLDGSASHDSLGASLAGLPDLDGDGTADVFGGATQSPGGTGYARAFSGATGAALFTFQGDSSGDRFGADVASAGDVDGDGVADLIVGAPEPGDAGNGPGFARVFSGASGAVLHDVSGTSVGDVFGSEVSGAGDADGDGFADFLVGAAGESGGAFDSGRVRVFSGVDGTVIHTFDGQFSNEGLGIAASSAGDVDADGTVDYVVGANPLFVTGEIFVFSGSTGAVIHALVGAPGDQIGQAVAVHVAGSPQPSGGPDANGFAQVLSGADASPLHTFFGNEEDEGFGRAVGSPGDVNGDGEPDFIVGATFSSSGGPLSGEARVFSTVPLPLVADEHELSLSAGGVQTMDLDADASLSNRFYLFLGSLSGTQPGTPSGSLVVPLNFDACLLYTSPSPRDQRGSRMPSSA